MGSFALVLLGFAWHDARAKRVTTSEVVTRGLGLNLVGVLPALPEGRRGSDGSWDHLMTESIDSARTYLLHASQVEQIRVLMVASALKGEGKTSLACHLGASLARARRRTLIIDCDLRSPAAHILFDLPVGPGVCEILRGEADAADVILPTAAPGVEVLPAGRCDQEALQALAEGRLGPVLERVRDAYDFVVVDSAPILPVADSLQVAQHVDAVLFSVLRDVSRLPKIYDAYSRLERLGVRLLGAVVAGTKAEDYEGYAYGYGNRAEAATVETEGASS